MSPSVQIISFTLIFLSLYGCSGTRSNSSTVEAQPTNNIMAGNFNPDLPSDKQNKEPWQKAVFMGLTMGVSSRDEAIKVLGKPTGSGDPEDQETEQDAKDPVLVDSYVDFNEIYQTLLVTSSKKSGKVYNIIATLRNPSLEAITTLFGNDFTRARYKFLECPGDSTTANVIESPDGDIEFLEYRPKGISFSMHNDIIEEIVFDSRPVGLQSAKCPPNGK